MISKTNAIELPSCPNCSDQLTGYDEDTALLTFQCGSQWQEEFEEDTATGSWTQFKPCRQKKSLEELRADLDRLESELL